MQMIRFLNIRSGKIYRWIENRVFVETPKGWRRVNHLRPADLACFPFMGIKK